MLRFCVVVGLLLGVAESVNGLTCRSGFNASVAGAPFYQWYQDTCADNSQCFGHEIKVVVQGLNVVVQYGGCVSKAYSSLITCESLFGQESQLNPAKLLDLVPNLSQNVQLFIQKFSSNLSANLQTLFSAGNNSQEFIAGAFKLYQNLGFNTDKMKPLEAPIGKLFGTIFAHATTSREQLEAIINETLATIASLDTANPGITADFYTFLASLGVPKSSIQGTRYAGFVEKLPGLFLSTLPASFEANRWYDEIFKVLSKLNVSNPVQSTKDMIVIVKATDWVPTEYKTYTDKFLDRLPELVEQLVAGNASYPGYWSTLLLMDYSEVTTATTELNNAITNFLTGSGVVSLPVEIRMVIKYLPGHFYNYFPDKRAEIDKVYGKIADGFKSFNFSDMSNTKPNTTMSNFIISFINKIAPGTLNATLKPYIINFSYMFHKLMEPDYSDKLDTFFTTLSEGFKNYPTFNLGQIVRNLVVNLGGTVPTEIEPLLTNIQNVVDTLVPTPNVTNMIQEMKTVINAYKVAYPNSLFPAIVEGYIDYTTKLVTFNYAAATPGQVRNFSLEIQLEAQYLAIDFQFALVQAMNLTTKQIETLMTSSFPEYGVLIKSLMVLKPADAKELVKNIVHWMFDGLKTYPFNLTPQGFVDAVKPTVEKMVTSLGDVVKDFRYVFSPDSCRSLECAMDNCNTNKDIALQSAVTKAPLATTTSASGKLSYSSLVITIVGSLLSLAVL